MIKAIHYFLIGSVMVLAAGCSEDSSPAPMVARKVEDVDRAVVQAPGPTSIPSTAQAATPERTLRDFFIALAKEDKEQIMALSIRNEGEEILWKMPKKSADDSSSRDLLIKMMENAPMRRLRAGETVTFPTRDGSRERTMTANDINDGRVLIVIGESWNFYTVLKVEGKWLVDPMVLIVGRQAAEHFRQEKAKLAPKEGI